MIDPDDLEAVLDRLEADAQDYYTSVGPCTSTAIWAYQDGVKATCRQLRAALGLWPATPNSTPGPPDVTQDRYHPPTQPGDAAEWP